MVTNSKEYIESTPDAYLVLEYKKSGDLRVFSLLFLRYYHLLFGVCMKYLRNAEDSKDAVMELFEKISIDLKKHDVQHFRSWIYVLTRNHCLMKLRKDKSHPEKATGDEFILHYTMESKQNWHPVNEDTSEEELEILEKCMGKLTDAQQECIRQFYLKKQSYSQIAGKLNIEIKKVKSYLQNGKRNLKICIENAMKN